MQSGHLHYYRGLPDDPRLAVNGVEVAALGIEDPDSGKIRLVLGGDLQRSDQ